MLKNIFVSPFLALPRLLFVGDLIPTKAGKSKCLYTDDCFIFEAVGAFTKYSLSSSLLMVEYWGLIINLSQQYPPKLI